MSYLIPTKHEGYTPSGTRTLNGGSGGGSSGVYYANQDKLLGAQADIATGMYNMVQPKMAGLVDNESKMVDQANDGTLTQQARATAGADASAAMGQGLAAAQRQTDRFGSTMNPNAQAHDTQTAGIQGAAMKSGAMNNAQQWGEGQKWARTTDMYNQLQGVPTQSASQLGSAAQGFGNAAAASTANMNTTATGLGRVGMQAFGNNNTSAPAKMKDGGEVHMADGGMVGAGLRRRPLENPERHFAEGGYTRLSDTPTTPLKHLDPITLQASHGAGQLTTAEQLAAFALPVAASEGLRYGVKAAGKALEPYSDRALKSLQDSYTKAFPNGPGMTQSASGVPDMTHTATALPDKTEQLDDAAYAAQRQATGQGGQIPTPMATPDNDSTLLYGGDTVADISPPIDYSNWTFKDGGPVRSLRTHFASGGLAGVLHNAPSAPAGAKLAPHITAPTISAPSAPAVPERADPAVTMAEQQGAKMGLKAAIKDSPTSAPVVDAAKTPVEAPTLTAEGANPVALDTGATSAAQAEALDAAATDAAATDAAATVAAEETALAAIPGPGWVVGGALLASEMFAKDGGQVQHGLRRQMADVSKIPRKDLRKGGHVSGPGTSTSDSIPAKLSNGEFVLNAEATAMVGKAKLHQINQRGLAARQGVR